MASTSPPSMVSLQGAGPYSPPHSTIVVGPGLGKDRSHADPRQKHRRAQVSCRSNRRGFDAAFFSVPATTAGVYQTIITATGFVVGRIRVVGVKLRKRRQIGEAIV